MSDETTVSETTTAPDWADKLIQRIQRIATENSCTMQQAAWAIMYIDSGSNHYLEPFPTENNSIPSGMLDVMLEQLKPILESASETTTELDRAEALLRRIHGIETRFPYFNSNAIAWAIMYTDSGYPNPYQEPFPE